MKNCIVGVCATDGNFVSAKLCAFITKGSKSSLREHEYQKKIPGGGQTPLHYMRATAAHWPYHFLCASDGPDTESICKDTDAAMNPILPSEFYGNLLFSSSLVPRPSHPSVCRLQTNAGVTGSTQCTRPFLP